jgi:hypothetical protein
MLLYYFYFFLLQLLNGVLLTQTQISGSGSVGETDEMITKLAADILRKVPKPFDVRAVSEYYPVLYTNSMNTVLRQVSYQNGGSYCHLLVSSSLIMQPCKCPFSLNCSDFYFSSCTPENPTYWLGHIDFFFQTCCRNPQILQFYTK